MSTQRLTAITAVLIGTLAGTARAQLKPGAEAPDFTAPASIGGQEFTFHLADALKQGPVVLYFYPAAFTSGCTEEAHEFAEATGRYKALGATVIGVSGDTIDTLRRFSVSDCQGKFALAADTDRAIMKAYDSVLVPMTSYASRTSYVITPDRRILYTYSAMAPDRHVANTYEALERWKAGKS
jgi:peroxiredoxin